MSSSSESPAIAGSTCKEEAVPESVGKAMEKAPGEGAPAADAEDAAKAEEEEPKLPPLTPAQFREYNRMAEHMDHFVSAARADI